MHFPSDKIPTILGIITNVDRMWTKKEPIKDDKFFSLFILLKYTKTKSKSNAMPLSS